MLKAKSSIGGVSAFIMAAAGANTSACQLMLDDRPEPGSPWVDLRALGAAEPEGVATPYRFGADTLEGIERDQGWSSDCEEAMSAFERDPAGRVALRVVGVQEQKLDLGLDYPPRGEVVVNLFRPGPTVLVLSADERTHWTIHVGAGAELLEVYASGVSRHSITAPAGVPVYNHSGAEYALPIAAVYWPSNEALELVIGMEIVTGLSLTSFHGCPRMSQVTMFERASISCDESARVDGGSCGGNVLAQGALADTASGTSRNCELGAIRGASCCSVDRFGWSLADGSPTPYGGGFPDEEPRSAWPCVP